MRSGARLLVAVGLLRGGVLALHGAFAILYDGDDSRDCGDITLTTSGRAVDANAFG